MLRITNVSGFRIISFFRFWNICISTMSSLVEQKSSKHKIHARFIFPNVPYIHNLMITLGKSAWNWLCSWKTAWWCGLTPHAASVLSVSISGFRCSRDGHSTCGLKRKECGDVFFAHRKPPVTSGHFCLQKSSGFLAFTTLILSPCSPNPVKCYFDSKSIFRKKACSVWLGLWWDSDGWTCSKALLVFLRLLDDR